MGTRAAAFTAKIRNLHDFHLRLTNGIMPPPTGLDIANTLKHFSQTLLVVLKDVPQFPLEMLKSRAEDAARMQLFPNLDYKGLFAVVVQLIDVAPVIQFGIQAFGQAILQTIACLLPFLEHEFIDTLPYIVASSLGTFPCSLHQDIIDLLCHYLLPFTLYNCHEQGDKFSYATQSVSAVLMMVLQYTASSEYHCQIMECIMSFKRDAVKDVFCVIAYGTLEARNVAINLLVYYWPHLNPTLYDRRGINFKFNGWKVPSCKSEMCSVNNAGGNADAVKICLDHSIGVSLAPENPPPLFLCQECTTRLQHEQPAAAEHMYDVLLPVQQISMTCENKLNCRSTDKAAAAFCFSAECASYNGNHPMRYCSQCHSIRHNNRRGLDHVFHLCLQSPVKNEVELFNYEVESIVSLLLEAEPLNSRGGTKDNFDQQTRMRLFTDGEFTDPIPNDERRLMGRYGIWLLVGFFNPDDHIPNDVLGRLLSVLFQWFNTTAFVPDDPSANALERLKSDVVCPWLRKVVKINFETFVSCLLPHPPEFARVGGHWDVISSRTFHLREGFNRLFCLVPYEVISPDIWSQIMPNWMEAMASEVPEEEMSDLKVILSKVMDPEMNPLGFDARQMYHFIAVRFHQTSHKVKEQALRWLQVLSKLEIVIPLYFIFSVFREGIRPKQIEKVPKRGSVSADAKDVISAICQDDSRNASSLSDDEENVALHTEQQSDSELMLSSFIFMLDTILKQLELQEVEQHKGLQTLVAKDAMVLLHNMVAMPWPGKHTCHRNLECQFCEMSVLWYQLALEIVQKLAPEKPALEPDIIMSPDGEFGSKLFPEMEKKLDVKADTKPSVSPKSESMGLEGIIVNMPQILTATVETVSELDLAPIMPSEKIVKAVARAVTITESDTASATAHVASATLINEEGGLDGKTDESGKDFWSTSVGKFKFSIDELPPYLQFTYELLKKIPDEEDSELLYHLLKCLKILFIHGEVMQKAAKDHRGFLIWCQENLLIKNIWELMDAEYSQICEQAVPILLHCITLPIGSDVFWRQIEEDFHSPDWRVRFTAVERVITVTRFMDAHPVRNSQALQTALSNAFCYAISSLDDPHVAVAQRTGLYLGTIHDSALQSLLYCLESQFDTVIIDRPVILQSLYLLLNSVCDRKILRWDFFLNCFDTLFIEAQILLERSGEIVFMKDQRNYDFTMEHFVKKLNRVQDGLYKSELPQPLGQKTLSSSLGKKWPYKRTMSAPAAFNFKHGGDKEKYYCRQSSAPVLKRKGSKHGLDGQIHSILHMDDSYLSNLFHRIVEFEESDRDTMHLLVFLFMQFLSRFNRGPIPSENKALARTQLAVLRHVTNLLGYNSTDKSFFLTPGRLRSSTVFNSFLSNLPQVLDQNFGVGKTLISTSLTVLHFCPAPNRVAGNRVHPYYSLWLLEKHVRRYWLSALIVILYKYEYSTTPLASQIQTVIRIVLNTLNHIEHRCRPLPATLVMDDSTQRSRDMSQATLNTGDGLEHIAEHDTPPMTPVNMQVAPPGFVIAREQRKGLAGSSKHPKPGTTRSAHALDSFELMSSTETDEIEQELAVIPESPKSQGSLEETGSCRDLMLETAELVPVQAAVVHQAQPIAAVELQTAEGLQTFHSVVQAESAKVVQPPAGVGIMALASMVQAEGKRTGGINWMMPLGPMAIAQTAVVESDAKSSSSVTSSSSGSKVSAIVKAAPEFPWHLSVQAAFQIAKIPAPPLERLLPVGFNPPPLSPTVKHLVRSTSNSPYESPESPMSRMDMITIGPTVRVDDGGSDTRFNFATAMEQPCLERPPVERLLSLGQVGEAVQVTDEQNKTLHKAESFGRVTSPKKLVKQPRVFETDSVFEHKHTDAKSQETGKSVGFMPHTRDDSASQARQHNLRQSCLRIGDDCVQERCSDCGSIIEVYGNEELGLCIVALETFIHKEPGLAAPFMPDILKCATKIALKPLYSWQAECNLYVPTSVSRVAHQFLRCVLHQLAPFGVFVQLFQTRFPERVKTDIFKAISFALTDFNELNPVAPLQLLFEALNSKKTLLMDTVTPVIENIAIYLECLPLEAASSTWTSVIPLAETFLRKILPFIQPPNGVDGMLRMMSCMLRLPGISAFKGILDPFSKIISIVIQNSVLKYPALVELCHLCHRGFFREREKLLLTRIAVYELVQALKFKTNIPDENFLMLVTFILQDSGGSLAPYVYVEDFPKFSSDAISGFSTSAAECMRQHLTDSIEFLADFHSLSKIKSNYKGIGCGLNEDTLGGVIKGGISQFIALELSRGNNRENRNLGRYLPWLYNPPSAIQQGPKEFLDCVAHIRVLSWLLLGSLTHSAMFGTSANTSCIPIPLEASCHVADHVHVIMTGFAEQSKASVLHMSSLFHAFILCQVWTVYLEQVGPVAQQPTSTDPLNVSTNILTDFWGKVTPAILQLISHSKVLAEMVNLHFLTLLESLLECNSSVFNRLLPLWSPVLYAHTGQLAGHVQVRLQTCTNYPPPELGIFRNKDPAKSTKETQPACAQTGGIEFPSPQCGPVHNLLLLKWVQRLQFKMGQIELQSSAATQFYPL
ncbi:unnamed protein product [Allacma fusca]|uniref:Protein unc-79 homolog n=1 Tax=Allacma fusca TaxID=39272 RepID=A0A8J2Q1W7_9HEXA|nr:unnamed protein product [Allacma fusca]